MGSSGNDDVRKSTDDSLRAERRRTDVELTRKGAGIEEDADAVLRTARRRADDVLERTRGQDDRERLDTDWVPRSQEGIDREREVEDLRIEDDRTTADDVLESEREAGRRILNRFLESERAMTDQRLDGERSRADDAVASRDNVLGVVSHDLMGMLGVISLSASSILGRVSGDGEGAVIRTSAERIKRAVGRMSRLLDDLLDVTSMDAGRLALTPGLHDARDTLGEALDAFRPLAAERGVRLDDDGESAPVMASFDEHRILQVIANLLSNALKVAPTGSAIVAAVEDLGHDVLFTVRDQGPGIAAAMLEPIFDRFHQVASVGRVGLGLGLFISRSIVDAHGGRIWAESTIGEGATFRFVLPRGVSPG